MTQYAAAVGPAPDQTKYPPGVTRETSDLSTPEAVRFRITREMQANGHPVVYKGCVVAVVGLLLFLLLILVSTIAWTEYRWLLVATIMAICLVAGGLTLAGVLAIVIQSAVTKQPSVLELEDGAWLLASVNRWYRIPVADVRAVILESYDRKLRWLPGERPPPDASTSHRPVNLLLRVDGGWIRGLSEHELQQAAFAAELIAARLPVANTMPVLPQPPTLKPLLEPGQISRLGWWGLVPLFLLSPLCAIWFFTSETYPAMASESWPRVQATVIESNREEKERGRSSTVTIDFVYRYDVNGSEYTGDGPGFAVDSRGWAVAALVRDHPPGSTVEVAVDPEDPLRSTPLPGGDMMLMTVFLALGVLTLFFPFTLPFLYPARDVTELRRRYFDRKRTWSEGKRLERERRQRL